MCGTLPTDQSVANNYGKFYKAYTEYLLEHIIPTQDSTDIIQLAKGCPFTDGAVVYQARAFYNLVYDRATNFTDDCRLLTASTGTSVSNEKGFDAIVYPNPSDGKFFITSHGQGPISVKLTDLQGKVVLEQRLSGEQDETELNSGDLNNGVYLVQITNLSKNETVYRKLVIQK